MQRKSYVITAALVLGLALGVVLGPTIRSGIASAQTPTPAQTTTGDSLWNSFVDKLAAALNISRSQLDTAMTDAGNSTADEAVQQGRLTQAQADALKQRLQNGDFKSLLGGRGGKGIGGHHLFGTGQAMFDAAAGALNLSTDELMTQLRSGQTLAEIAQAQGTTEQAVIDAARAAARTQLDQAVTDGTLTQAQADSIYSELQSRGADLLTHRGRGHGFGGRGGRDGMMPAPSASPSASPQSSDA